MLLRQRIQERNVKLIENFTKEKQRHNSRGILHSSICVTALHKVLESEFKHSAHLIVQTALVTNRNRILPISEKVLLAWCTDALTERRRELDSIYESHISGIVAALSNSSFIAPYKRLDETNDLIYKEMSIDLSDLYERLLQKRYGTNSALIIRKLASVPLVTLVVSALVIAILLGFLGPILDLLYYVGSLADLVEQIWTGIGATEEAIEGS